MVSSSGKKNILEEIIRYFLDRSLNLRFDICTCRKCKEKMMQFLLSKFSPIYVNPNHPNYEKVKSQTSREYVKYIFKEIPKAIEYVHKNCPHPLEEDKGESLENLLQKIKQHRGVDFTRYRRELLKRRLAIRMVANKVKSYSEYLNVLMEEPYEYEKLFKTLTINISEFFRDPFVWAIIKDILGRMVDYKIKHKEKIRIWSTACAKGEEPYSLAVILKEMGETNIPIQIFATDIDRESLAQAREGIYSPEVFKKAEKNVSAGSLVIDIEKYFTEIGGNYQVTQEVRNMVSFEYLDLTSSDYLTDIDMILCRNVFIYFTKGLQEHIVDKFYRSLKDRGILVTGETESLISEARPIFEPLGKRQRIYQKIKV